MNQFQYTPERIVEEIFSLYEKHGDEDYYAEPVSQLQHMSQAAILAQQEGYEDEVILAAFFYDMGMGDYLRERGFSERMVTLVDSHKLSQASKGTLEFHGGRMNEAEAAEFEQHPDAKLFIRLRLWHNKAKETDLMVQNISHLKSLAIKHLYNNSLAGCSRAVDTTFI
jgi:predicted HD phosphohydrolase